MKKLTIKEQVKELMIVAKQMFANGKSTQDVILALNNIIVNSGFSNQINVDAIQYLAKQK